LSDVPDVIDPRRHPHCGHLNDKPAIVIIIFRNRRQRYQTVDNIAAQLPSIKASIPRHRHHGRSHHTTTIRASVKDVERSLIISSYWSSPWCSCSKERPRHPHTQRCRTGVAVRDFAAMYLGGYSIDSLSLMALTISTGFVVDDAIVVMEDLAPPRGGARPSRQPSAPESRLHCLLHQHFADRCLHSDSPDDWDRRPVSCEFAIVLSAAILVSMIVSSPLRL
jgi:multidrug efflux pump